MKSKLSFLPYVLMYLVSLLLIGMGRLVTAEFSVEYLRSAAFWYDLIITNVANLMVLVATVWMWGERFDQTDEVIRKKNAQIQDCVDRDLGPDFDAYLAEINRAAKIRAWKRLVYRRRQRLERRMRDRDRRAWQTEEGRRRNRKCKRLAALNRALTDEYIEANIEELKVRYEVLTRAVVTSGHASREERDEQFVNGSAELVRVLIPRVLIGIAGVCFVSSFMPRLRQFDPVMLVDIGVKVMALCYNWLVGTSYARRFRENITIANLDTSLGIITRYLQWRIDRRSALGHKPETDRGSEPTDRTAREKAEG